MYIIERGDIIYIESQNITSIERQHIIYIIERGVIVIGIMERGMLFLDYLYISQSIVSIIER